MGFTQLLLATADGRGVNASDAEENLLGAARHLNDLVRAARRAGREGNDALREALASDNGGSAYPPESLSYADAILERVR